MREFSRYERQYLLKEIGREGQRRLDESRVVVVGLGALGSVSANLLARAGIGRLLLIDRDFVRIDGLQRHALYDEEDARTALPKAIAARDKLKRINSEICIDAAARDVNPETIESLMSGAQLIVDGTDNFETRFLINDFSLKTGIPWIYGGALRTEGMCFTVLPGEGPCLRCLFGQAPLPGPIQTCDQAGILAPVAHLIASFQSTEAIKYLAGRSDALDRRLWKVDIWSRKFQAISVDHLESWICSGCRKKYFPYLDRDPRPTAVALCGRNAVQVYGEADRAVNFQDLARDLAGRLDLDFNEHLLRVRIIDDENERELPYEITIFRDGRAIVKGTEDTVKAKGLYARCLGG